MEYEEFILTKGVRAEPTGFHVELEELGDAMFDFQRVIVQWALQRGRAAIFADTGLGKTIMQTTWAEQVFQRTGHNVLILAPLCVAQQTVEEAAKFGIDIHYCRQQSQVKSGITITNYEMLEKFDASTFGAIVLDESSILKSHDSKTRQLICDTFEMTPYRLSCTATPSPNDYIELGNQAQFLGIMSQVEMLATFFTHDGGDTSKWRLKNHGIVRFWEWMSMWSICIRNPFDLGFDGARYILPSLNLHEHIVSGGELTEGNLFPVVAQSLTERRQAKKNSMADRMDKVMEIVGDSSEPWIIWCHLNSEQEQLERIFGDRAFSVYGSLPFQEKERRIWAWMHGERPIIISKQSIMGFGINAQFCSKMVFAGMDDSFESYYQAVRRCYRFGQKKEVDVHLIVADTEGAVRANIERKQHQANGMANEMVKYMRELTKQTIKGATKGTETYNPIMPIIIPSWVNENVDA